MIKVGKDIEKWYNVGVRAALQNRKMTINKPLYTLKERVTPKGVTQRSQI